MPMSGLLRAAAMLTDTVDIVQAEAVVPPTER